VRRFDIKFLKPLLLREKFISKDDKLLSTFRKITKTNAEKMAEKPDFILTTASNLERLKKETLSTEDPKLKIIVHRHSDISNFEDVRF
jgi:hypothetical protein